MESLQIDRGAHAAATDRQPKVTVVLPVLNEAESVRSCVDEAWRGLQAAGLKGEVVVVDNGSTDGSAELAASAGARVIHEPHRGYGSAIRRGIAEASGEIVVMADADATYDLSRVGDLVAPIVDDEADIVLAARLNGTNSQTMPALHRLVGTPALSLLARRAAPGLDVRDSQSGYRAMRTAAVRDLNLRTSGMEFASEMLIRASQRGLRVGERYIEYRERVGESKLQTLRDGLRHLQLIILLAPHLLLFWPGAALMLTGLALSLSSILNGSGVEIGSLRWQPIFFGPTLTILGTIGLLAGAVISAKSRLVSPAVARRYAFAARPSFPVLCIAGGLAALALGLAIDLVLLVRSIAGAAAPGSPALAGLAQALVISGAASTGLGVVQRIVELHHSYESQRDTLDIAQVRTLLRRDQTSDAA